MKKSKILIPAFAVLALSVGASVTGTVAWFTASRSQSFTSSFAVKDINGDLGIDLKGNKNAGTSVENKTIKVDGSLTHGSFDATNKSDVEPKLYVASLSNDPDTGKFIVDRYNNLGTIPSQPTSTEDGNINSKWLAGKDKEKNNLWYGVAWEATVTLGESGISGTNHLFLDFNTSTASDKTKANSGFRLAIMGNTGNDAIVLGNNTQTVANQTGHVTGVDKGDNKGKFTKWHTFGETVDKAMDEQTLADFTSNAGYIGEFKNPVEGNYKINLKFVAWFEGEDTEVVSGNTATTAVAATLSFYARRATQTA